MKFATLGLAGTMIVLIVAFNIGGQHVFGFNIGLLTLPMTLLLLASIVALVILFANQPQRPYVPRARAPRAQQKPSTQKPKPPVVSKEEKQVAEMHGGQMLEALRDFCYACASNNEPDVKRLTPVIQAIGRRLNEEGGMHLMQTFYSRVGQVKSLRTLDKFWDGIGEWQG